MRTLVLNADYTPINIIGWREAMGKVYCKHNATPLSFHTTEVVNAKFGKDYITDGDGNEYEVPCVILNKTHVNIFNKLAPYSKTNVYARDLEVCQYCGKQTSHTERTVDHVIPRSKFRTHHPRPKYRCSSFENVVTCCRKCNLFKGDRTPQQAGLKLLRQPRRIMQKDAYANKLKLGTIPRQWLKYLVYDDEEQTEEA